MKRPDEPVQIKTKYAQQNVWAFAWKNTLIDHETQ